MQKVLSRGGHSPRRPIWKLPNRTGLCVSVGRGYVLELQRQASKSSIYKDFILTE